MRKIMQVGIAAMALSAAACTTGELEAISQGLAQIQRSQGCFRGIVLKPVVRLRLL